MKPYNKQTVKISVSVIAIVSMLHGYSIVNVVRSAFSQQQLHGLLVSYKVRLID